MAAMFPPLSQAVFFYMGTAALLFSLIALGVTVTLYFKVRKLTLGKNGADLEETIKELASRTNDFIRFRTELEAYLREADLRISRSIQGVATVRFNPFHGDGSGGNQSFATAFLDENGDGVVISTLYARDRVSVFGKPVTKGTSTYELTGEEKEALTQATLAPKKSR